MLDGMDHRWRLHDLACELPRWSGTQHLEALRRHIVPGPGIFQLDLEGYAAELSAGTGLTAEGEETRLRLVLDRVVCPELDGPHDDGQWVQLGCGTRVRLGDCPWSERVQAAREALEDEAPEGLGFDPVQVAERVLGQVLELADAPEPLALADLSAGSVVQLATALLDRYDRVEAPGEQDDYDELEPEDLEAEQVRLVLALHRSLGRGRLPAPHTPPRCERPKPRWPPQSLPAHPPLLVSPLGSLVESKSARSVRGESTTSDESSASEEPFASGEPISAWCSATSTDG